MSLRPKGAMKRKPRRIKSMDLDHDMMLRMFLLNLKGSIADSTRSFTLKSPKKTYIAKVRLTKLNVGPEKMT